LNKQHYFSKRDLSNNNVEDKVVYICENNSTSIQLCPETMFIDNDYLKKQTTVIKNAIYGRRYGDRTHCTHTNLNANDKCYIDLTKKIYENCKGKSSCLINPSNANFGDPCPNVFKYFELKYYCQKNIVMDEEGLYFVNGTNVQFITNMLNNTNVQFINDMLLNKTSIQIN